MQLNIHEHVKTLKSTGARFVVERNAKVASGQPVRQNDWKITEVTPATVTFFRSEGKKAAVKTVSHAEFAEWQFNWLGLMEKRVQKESGSIRQQPLTRARVYQENQVTDPIRAIYDAVIRHRTGV